MPDYTHTASLNTTVPGNQTTIATAAVSSVDQITDLSTTDTIQVSGFTLETLITSPTVSPIEATKSHSKTLADGAVSIASYAAAAVSTLLMLFGMRSMLQPHVATWSPEDQPNARNR